MPVTIFHHSVSDSSPLFSPRFSQKENHCATLLERYGLEMRAQHDAGALCFPTGPGNVTLLTNSAFFFFLLDIINRGAFVSLFIFYFYLYLKCCLVFSLRHRLSI